VDGSTVDDNLAYTDGGGIYIFSGTTTVDGSTVSANTAENGGGIRNKGTLNIQNGSIIGGAGGGNTADIHGGGISTSVGTTTVDASTVSANSAVDYGGGIINSGTLIIVDSTFNGNSAEDGGGIFNNGTTTVNNSTLSGNSSDEDGGGIYNFDGGSGGTITLNHCTVTDNTADSDSDGVGDGGGIYNYQDSSATTINFKSTIVTGNNDLSGTGAEDCLNHSGTLASQDYNLTGSGTGCSLGDTNDQTTADAKLLPLADNGGDTETHALITGSPALDQIPAGTNGCGTTYTEDQRGEPRPFPTGGSCDIGSYEHYVRYVATTGSDSGNDCTVSGSPCATVIHAVNEALGGDTISIASGTYTETGSINVSKNLQFVGAGVEQSILDGGGTHRVLAIGISVNVNITDLTLQNGYDSTGNGGGGINNGGNLTLIRTKVTGNSATTFGGGILTYGDLAILDSTISDNQTVGTNKHGGGIFITGLPVVTIERTTISGNSATGPSGGIHNQGEVSLELTNVTISDNTAYSGGGMTNTSVTTTTILNSTVANNHLLEGGHTGGIANFATLNIKNTIVAGNEENQCITSGTWTSQGYNISSDATCDFTQPGDLPSTDPLLAALADYGGYTLTHALLAGSPAIDAGTDTGCPDTDQRGISRPVGAHCDIGAFEGEVTISAPVADFDGNGDTDVSVFRSSNGRWYMMGQSSVSWALTGDLPVPGDYNGDGTTDIAIYRPSNGKWYIKDQGSTSWGFSGDIPVQADYDGDGSTEIAVLRPSNGRWYIEGMGNFSWYHSGDIPVPCDYDGDGADEIAVFRPSNNKWYVMGSSPVSWAQSGDIPVPADYDGDGSCDIAVYRPSNGNWYVQGNSPVSWGYPDDIPVPGDYDGDGATEIAILRPSNGRWYIQGVGNFSWYFTGDYPLPVRDTNADGDPYQ